MANKKSKDVEKRNEMIKRDFEKRYSPEIKKSHIYTVLAQKYNLSMESIRMIATRGETNASRTLNNLKVNKQAA